MSQSEILETLALPPHYLCMVQHLMRTEKMKLRDILRNTLSTEAMYRPIDDAAIAEYRKTLRCE
jgi:hypothetical protein